MTWRTLSVFVTFQICLCLPGVVFAQRGLRDHIRLPRTSGATVLSTYIDSHARLIAATGDYLESVAVARLIHTEAASREMDNSLKWVETYFERKLLNKDYRWNKMYTPHVELERKRNSIKATLIIHNPAILMERELTKTMNWILSQLSTFPDAQTILFRNDRNATLERFNFPFEVDDLEKVNLCLFERTTDGSQTSFPANGGSPLLLDWPAVLQKDRYSSYREEFDQLKDQILKDGMDGKIEYATLEATESLINRFHGELEKEYPKEVRAEPKFYFEYKPGSNYLNVQLAAIKLAVNSNNADAITGEYAFHGDSLFELLNHMSQNGLQFSSPPVGSKYVYTKIFLAMRNFYIHCQGGQPAEFNFQKIRAKRPANNFFGDN